MPTIETEGKAKAKQADNITANLPAIINAIAGTPFGEIRIITREGRIVAIERTEKILPVE